MREIENGSVSDNKQRPPTDRRSTEPSQNDTGSAEAQVRKITCTVCDKSLAELQLLLRPRCEMK